jgi:recombinational DNA repair ATPase RecF
MHIKAVVIKGFKSYYSTSSELRFSPEVNCIVGQNGTGKSNFFEGTITLTISYNKLYMLNKMNFSH